MAFSIQSYRVTYSGVDTGAWDSSFKSLTFQQSGTSEISWALHRFQGAATDQSGAELNADRIISDLTKTLTGASALLKFKIEPVGGTGDGTTQCHIVDDWWLETHPAAQGGSLIVVRTVAAVAAMNVDYKNRAHSGKKVSDILSSIVGQYPALKVGSVESTVEISEFATLRQSNMTDYEFILSHLLPRAQNATGTSGYDLVVPDGCTIGFSTAAYKHAVYRPDPEQVITIVEHDKSFPAARMGGSSIVVDGFDHYAKKAIRKELSPSDFKPSYGGSVDATMTGKRYDYVPMQSPQAVEAWARARLYRHRPTAFMFTAKLRGAVDLTIPAWLDLSGTKFRSRDNQVGVITKAVHTVTGGAYTMLLTCERDKFNP